MPSLIGSLDEQIASQQGANQSAEEIARIAREAKEDQTFARLDRLTLNEDWKWFSETYLKGILDSEHKKALDISKPPDIRNNGAQRFDIAQEIIGLAQRERDKLHKRIQTRGQKGTPS